MAIYSVQHIIDGRCKHKHRRIEAIPLTTDAIVVCMDCGMYWELSDEPQSIPIDHNDNGDDHR